MKINILRTSDLNRYLKNMDKTKPNNFIKYLLYKTAAYIVKIN